jgi:nucleoside 2-deoxyribosyltransferase
MSKIRIYLSGPVSRNPAWRQELGRAKEELLRRFTDVEIISPAEIDMEGHEGDWYFCMRKCVAAMLTCDKVVVLPDTDVSLGRSVEVAIASMLRIQFISLGSQTAMGASV